MFRNNVGFGWLANRKDEILTDNGVLLKNARRVKYGLETGSSDLVGFTKIKITQGMVGQEIAIFTSIEVKSIDGRLSKDQKNWLDFVSDFGGISGVARSLEEAARIVFK